MKKLVKLASISLLFTPLAAFAQVPNPTYVSTLLSNIRDNATFIITLLFVFATLVFLWGLVQYIASGSDDAKKKAKQHMTWGVIGLAVMGSVWGITRILTGYFGVETGNIPDYTDIAQ